MAKRKCVTVVAPSENGTSIPDNPRTRMRGGRHLARCRLLPQLLEVVRAEELDHLQTVWLPTRAIGRPSRRPGPRWHRACSGRHQGSLGFARTAHGRDRLDLDRSVDHARLRRTPGSGHLCNRTAHPDHHRPSAGSDHGRDRRPDAQHSPISRAGRGRRPGVLCGHRVAHEVRDRTRNRAGCRPVRGTCGSVPNGRGAVHRSGRECGVPDLRRWVRIRAGHELCLASPPGTRECRHPADAATGAASTPTATTAGSTTAGSAATVPVPGRVALDPQVEDRRLRRVGRREHRRTSRVDPGAEEQDGPAGSNRREQRAGPEPPLTQVLQHQRADDRRNQRRRAE